MTYQPNHHYWGFNFLQVTQSLSISSCFNRRERLSHKICLEQPVRQPKAECTHPLASNTIRLTGRDRNTYLVRVLAFSLTTVGD